MAQVSWAQWSMHSLVPQNVSKWQRAARAHMGAQGAPESALRTTGARAVGEGGGAGGGAAAALAETMAEGTLEGVVLGAGAGGSARGVSCGREHATTTRAAAVNFERTQLIRAARSFCPFRA